MHKKVQITQLKPEQSRDIYFFVYIYECLCLGFILEYKFENRQFLIFFTSIFVPISEENGLFMLGVVFSQSIFTDQKRTFNKIFLYPIEDIDYLTSIKKKF